MRAQQIGHARVIVIPSQARLRDAARVMRKHQVGCLIVATPQVDGMAPIGMLTHRDIVLKGWAADGDLDAATVAQVMSAPPVCCRLDHTLAELVGIMCGSGVRRLPMVDERGILVGIVCSNDVLAAISELLSDLASAEGATWPQDRLSSA